MRRAGESTRESEEMMDDLEYGGLPAERVPGEVVETYTRPVEPVTVV